MTKAKAAPIDWERTPADCEEEILRKWDRYIRNLSKSVYYIRRLAMDREDVRTDLQEALIRRIRRSVHVDHEVAPSEGLIMTVLVRRIYVLRRDSSTKFREALYNDFMPGDQETPDTLVADEGPSQEDLMSQEELAAVCGALAYALRRNLTPAVFALLHLRCVEELPAARIAEMAALPGWEHVSGRVYWAKGRAQAFLQSLGITDWETVSSLNASEFAHDDLE